jgi:ubiquitin-protein ligase
MNFAKKRLLKDISSLHNAKLNESGIFFHVNETNLFDISLLFFPRKDTPFEHCPLLFKLTPDPTAYPFSPPKVTFIPLGTRRIHPNFYTCGKVCLSIINTWKGPQWSPSQTLLSIAITILSVIDELPLIHEPGFENDFHEQLKFNRFLQYETLLNVVRLFKIKLNDHDSHLLYFQNIICNYYDSHFTQIKNKIHSLQSSNPPTYIFLSFYQINAQLDFNYLSDLFPNIFEDTQLKIDFLNNPPEPVLI